MHTDRAAAIGGYAAAAWLVLWTAVNLVAPSNVAPDTLYALAPLLVCAVMSWRGTVLFAVAAVLLVVWSGWLNGTWSGVQQWIRLLDVVLVGSAAVGIAYIRVRREQQHGQELEAGGDAERRAAAAGELEDQPVLGDALHPGAGVRDDAARGVEPVVAVAEGAEGGAHRFSGPPHEHFGVFAGTGAKRAVWWGVERERSEWSGGVFNLRSQSFPGSGPPLGGRRVRRG